MTYARVTRLVADHAGVPVEAVGPLNTLEGDLDLDSLDRVDLWLALETEFAITIPEWQANDMDGTVGGLCAMVADKLTEPLVVDEREARLARLLTFGVDNWRERFKLSDQPTGMGLAMKLANESGKRAVHHLRAAFDAGVRAGRCDPNPEAAWIAFKDGMGL